MLTPSSMTGKLMSDISKRFPLLVNRSIAVLRGGLPRHNLPLPAVQMLPGHANPNLTTAYVLFPPEELQQATRFFLERDPTRRTSARNLFFGKIRAIRTDELMASLELVTMDGETITTVITNSSRERLGLVAGKMISAKRTIPPSIPPSCREKVGKIGWPGIMSEQAEHFALHRMAKVHQFSPPGTPTDLIRNAAVSGKPYPIKGFVGWGQNPIQTIPDQDLTIRMLAQMDFVMICDIMPTDITAHADILLPELSYLERCDGYIHKGTQWNFSDPHQQYISARQPLVSPVSADHERRDSIWIINELAKRMGLGEHIPVKSAEEMVDRILAANKLSLAKQTEEDGIHLQPGSDPYGKALPVAFFSQELAEAGYPAIPTYIPVAEPPKGFARLVYGRAPVHTFNRSQNNVWLHNEMPENPIWLNDESAKRMGLKDGDRVEIINQDGVKSRTGGVIKATPGIRKDTVYMAHGYGTMSQAMRVASNQGVDDQSLITRLAVDPETGAHGMRNNFVRFIKAGKVLSIPASS